MFRVEKIQDITNGLVGEVGFIDPTISGYESILSEANKTKRSGLSYEDASPLVNIKTIKDLQSDSGITDEEFNAYLARMQKSVALEVCNKVIKGHSQFLGLENMFPFEKSFDNTESAKTGFVGFELYQRIGNTVCLVPWVELSFNEAVSFTLYLYNSNKPKNPILNKAVTAVAGESKIETLNWILSDDFTFKGGKFYLGYFASDIGSALPYKKEHDIASLQVETPYYFVDPMQIASSGTKIDVKNVTYTSDTHGLNIGVNTYMDYTESILRNKNIFWQALQMQMHEKVLNLILTTDRSNNQERITKEMIGLASLELYGNKEKGIVGIQEKLNNEIAQIKDMLFYAPAISKATLSR